MANMTEKKARNVQTALTRARLTGIDWEKLIALVKKLLAMFGGCIPLAQRRARMHIHKQWYPGYAVHAKQLDDAIADSDCCTGEGDNPATDDYIKKAVLDEVSNSTATELATATNE